MDNLFISGVSGRNEVDSKWRPQLLRQVWRSRGAWSFSATSEMLLDLSPSITRSFRAPSGCKDSAICKWIDWNLNFKKLLIMKFTLLSLYGWPFHLKEFQDVTLTCQTWPSLTSSFYDGILKNALLSQFSWEYKHVRHVTQWRGVETMCLSHCQLRWYAADKKLFLLKTSSSGEKYINLSP